MEFLFFDTECANCYGGKGKIYSFGYLITDEEFNILTPPQDILLNPNCKFDPYVRKNILVYDRAYLKTMPKFDERYEFLKELLTKKGRVCFGYGIDNDLRFLSDECKRYSLPQLKPVIYDVQRLIAIVENKPARKLSVEFTERFGEQDGAHRSDVDAIRTMMIAKHIFQKTSENIVEILKKDKKSNRVKKIKNGE